MGRLLLLSSLLLLSLAAPALAAKPKKCFTAPEMTAEREVRHGIYLREASRRCQGRFLADSERTWRKFEEDNGGKFRAAVARRAKAWQREFPDDWQYKLTHADGRLVTYARHLPVTRAFCDGISDILKQITARGYGGFSGQAKIIKNEVVQDYRACP